MSKDLGNYRQKYTKGALNKAEVPKDPFQLFQDWFEDVEESENLAEVNAMSLSTLGKDGFPKTRIVLLKAFNMEGFTFYTNYTSDKGKALEGHPQACISFFWPEQERQVIIKGMVKKISRENSEKYFHSRPRGSQLGAWVSNQSSEIASREVLENKLQELEKKYKGKEIPKPDFWGGYILKPVSFEFWQGRENRLHDRILFTALNNNQWDVKRLAP